MFLFLPLVPPKTNRCMIPLLPIDKNAALAHTYSHPSLSENKNLSTWIIHGSDNLSGFKTLARYKRKQTNGTESFHGQLTRHLSSHLPPSHLLSFSPLHLTLTLSAHLLGIPQLSSLLHQSNYHRKSFVTWGLNGTGTDMDTHFLYLAHTFAQRFFQELICSSSLLNDQKKKKVIKAMN